MYHTLSRLRRGRSGFTLVELLLVLVLVVIVFALVMPQLNRARTRGRLRAAGDQIRTGWSKARNRAMREGIPQAFVYLPESRYFTIVPATLSGVDMSLYQQVMQSLEQAASAEQMGDNPNVVSLSAPVVSSATTASSSTTGQSAGNTVTMRLEHLPDDILIASSGPDGYNVGSSSSAAALPLSSSTMSLSTAGAPVLFMPDGTAQDVTIWLRNEEGQMISISLRALTGGSTVGSVLTGADNAVTSVTP